MNKIRKNFAWIIPILLAAALPLLRDAQAQTFRTTDKLEVTGYSLMKSSVQVNGELRVSTTSVTNYVMRISSGTGASGQQLFSVTNGGNVGIGPVAPQDALHIVGQFRIDDNSDAANKGCLRYNGTANHLEYSNDCVAFQTFAAPSAGGWTDNGSIVSLTTPGDFVGVGTASPAYKLHVAGNAVVTSSLAVSGSGLSGTTPVFQVIGGTLTVQADGRTGIGTATPLSRLVVVDNNAAPTLTTFTQDIAAAGILMQTLNGSGYYTPGLFWAASNDNPSRPKAGIWLYQAAAGTDMYFGTSNNYATGITNNGLVIYRDGNVGVGLTAPVKNLDVGGSIQASGIIYSSTGTAALPGYTFTGDPNTGLHAAVADQLAVTTGGTDRLTINSAQLTSALPWRAQDGYAAAPAFSFINNNNLGMYRVAENQLGFATVGTNKMTISAADIQTTLPWRGQPGTAAAPAFSFSADNNVGMYNVTTDVLGFATNGLERMRIDASGRVGIGAIAPEQMLDVAGTIQARRIADATAGVTRQNSNQIVLQGAYWDAASNSVAMRMQTRWSPDGTYVYFSIQDHSGTDRLIVRNDGFVGISTAAPAQKLDVQAGNIQTSGVVYTSLGTLAAPSYSFTGDTDTGMYSLGAGLLGFVTNNVRQMEIGTSTVTFTLPLRGIDGTAALPAYSFTSDIDTGFYRPASDTLAVTAAGSDVMRINGGTDITSYLPWRGQNGTQALPAFSFSGDPDTGMYRYGAEQLAFATAGTYKMLVNAAADIQATLPFRGQDGGAAAPAFSFTGDNDTGIFRLASDQFGFATAGINRMEIGSSSITLNLPLRGQDGTAALPAFAFALNPNTGMYRYGTDQLAFSTNGTYRMLLNSATDLQTTIPVRGPDGALQTAPAFSFVNDSDTGMYQLTADQLGFATGGVNRFDIGTSSITSTLPLRGQNGVPAAPAYSFSGDLDTGIYLIGQNTMGLVTASTLRMEIALSSITLTLPLRLPAGLVGTPALSFVGDADTGIYWVAADQMGFAAGGANRMTVTNADIQTAMPLRLPNGTAAAPALTFTGDNDTGIYQNGDNQLAFATFGTTRMDIGVSSITATLPWRGANGTAAAPAFSFSGDTDTGIYRYGAEQLAFTTGSGYRMLVNATTDIQTTLPVRGPNGSASAPAFSFSGDNDTGMYYIGPDQFGFATNGINRMEIGSSSVTVNLPLRGSDGTQALPGFAFATNPNTGIYRPGADQMAFSTNGTYKMYLNSGTDIQTTLPIRGPDGALQAAPAFSFAGDTNTGMYRLAADQFGFATGGVNRFDIGTSSITATLPLYAPDGSQGAPAFSFATNPNTGIYRYGADQLGFATAGTYKMLLNSGTDIQITTYLRGNGAALQALPAFSFMNDTDTGMYRLMDNQFGFATGGVNRFDIGTGSITVTVPVRGVDGSPALPAYSFSGDMDTGIYRIGDNQFGFATGGVNRFDIGTSSITATLPVRGQDGLLAAPAFAFASDTDVGIYRSGGSAGNQFGFAINGANKLDIGVSSVTFTQPLRAPDGNQAVPAFSFSLDPDVGMYRISENQFGFATGGVNRFDIGTSSVTAWLPLRGSDGTQLLPAFSFAGDTDLGIYRYGADIMGFTTGGTYKMLVSGADIQATLPWRGQNGTPSAPSLSFVSDPDTGLYRSGIADQFGFVTGGVNRFDIGTSSITVTLPLRMLDGAIATPAYSFASDPDLGIFRSGSDQLSFVNNSYARMTITSADIQATLAVRGPDGTAAAPAFSFTGDQDMGIYRYGADQLAFATLGAYRMLINVGTDIQTTIPLRGPDGAVGTPAYSFTGDPDTGMYRVGDDQLGFATGGVNRFDIGTSSITVTLPLRGQDGVLATPGLSFSGDPDVGMYRSGGSAGNQFGFAINGSNKLDIGVSSITVSQPVRGTDGSQGIPAFSFSLDPDVGMYRISDNQFGFVTGGVNRFDIGTSSITATLPLRGQDAALQALPAYSFAGDPDTGMYRLLENQLGFATGGVNRFDIGTTSITVTLPFRGPNGSAAAPAYSFTGDTDTGIYGTGAKQLSFVTGGASRMDIYVSSIVISQPVRGPDAAPQALPAYSFAGDPDTGMYRLAADQLGFATGGVNRFDIGTSSITATLPLREINGSQAFPAYSFTGDEDTGMYRIGADQFGFATGGVNRLDLGTSSITATIPFRGQDGAQAAPAYSFTGDPDVGMYRAGANQLGFATGGTLKMDIFTSSITATLPLRGQPGTAAAPAFSFSGDIDTGMYWVGSDQLGFSAGNNIRMTVTAAAIQSYLPVLGADGSDAAPEFSFSGDSDTGMYRVGADQLGFATNATNRMTITATDIQTTLPLHGPVGSAALPALSFSADTNTGLWSAADQLGFATGGGNRMTITTTDIQTTLPWRGSNGTQAIPAVSFTGDPDTGIYHTGTADQLAFAAGGVNRMTINAAADIQAALPLRALDGTAASPAFSFVADPDIGIYRVGVEQLGFATNGSNRMTVTAADIQAALPVRGALGTAAAPALSFTGDIDTGIYGSADQLNLVTGGVARMEIGANFITAALPWRGQNGTAAAPALSFTTDPDTGMYLLGPDQFGFATNATLRFDIGTSSITATLPLRGQAGTAAAPAFSFFDDTNTGIYGVTPDQLAFATNGANRMTLNAATDIQATLPWRGPDGAQTAPAFSFIGDPDTGMYWYGIDQLGFATNATYKLLINAAADIQSTLPIRGPNGAQTAPAFSFTGDLDTGMFRNGADQLALATGGVYRLMVNSATDIQSTLQWRGPYGSAASPAFSFVGDIDTGMYGSASGDVLGFATNALSRLAISAADIQATLPLLGPYGSAAAPAFSFSGDVDTGIYGALGQVGLATAGTYRMLLNAGTDIQTTLPLRGPYGSAAAPAFSFSGDPDTGMYGTGGKQLSFATDGTSRMDIFVTSITVSLPLREANGTAGAPSFSFANDGDTGMYGNGSDQISFATLGTNRMDIGSANIAFTVPMRGQDGTQALPAFSFTGDTDLGMYRIGSDQFGFSTGGTYKMVINAATDIQATLPVRGANGSATAPAFSFSGDNNTGIYNTGTPDQLAFATGGVYRMMVNAAADIQTAVPVRGLDGSQSGPAFSFTDDSDTGIYRYGTNQLAFTAGGAYRLMLNAATDIQTTLPVRGPNGSAAAPAFSFSADPDTGIYETGVADQLAFATGGTYKMMINADIDIQTALPWRGQDGLQAAPAFSFTSDPDVGMYRLTTDQFGFATAGINRMDIGTSSITVTLPLRGINGTPSVPAYSFVGDPDTGFYSSGPDQLSLATNGASRMDIMTTSITVSLPLAAAAGAQSAPAYSFTGDLDTGMYRPAADQLGFATGGVLKMDIFTSSITATLPFRGPAGSATAPAFSFSGDSNTGIYNVSADNIGFVTNGVLRMSISNNGIGIGMSTQTYQLQLFNDSAAKPGANTWTVYSDIRLKKNVMDIEDPLGKMLKLRGVTYEWKDPSTQGNMKGRYMGLIAQEVEKVFPEWVGTGGGGYKNLTVSGFEGLTAEAVRQLNNEVDTLAKTVEEQEKALAELERIYKQKGLK